jgi:hypothetical protein
VSGVVSSPAPGSLPQTQELPSAATTGFRSEIAALWQGIRSGDPQAAMPAYFPEAAYAQVKSIGDPHADYAGRLVRDFTLDIAAAHALLGTNAVNAQLLGVDVPSGYAHWVPPGTCDNGVGYYEIAHSRLVYSQGGEIRSFGIASMISWRGVWYVIHLGAITRSADEGVVEDPSAGRGTSAPSSSC